MPDFSFTAATQTTLNAARGKFELKISPRRNAVNGTRRIRSGNYSRGEGQERRGEKMSWNHRWNRRWNRGNERETRNRLKRFNFLVSTTIATFHGRNSVINWTRKLGYRTITSCRNLTKYRDYYISPESPDSLITGNRNKYRKEPFASQIQCPYRTFLTELTK